MSRWLLPLFACWILTSNVSAQREMGGRSSTSPSSAETEPAAPSAVATPEEATAEKADAVETIKEAMKENAAPKPARAVAIDGVPRIAQITWHGHAFVYVTTPTGVRIAFDPYESPSLKYNFPRNLAADVVMTSNERTEHAAANRLAGNPQVFRSYTAVGSNRANGLLIKGVEVPSEPRKDFDVSKSVAYVFEVDGLRYAHFGMLGDRLSSPEARSIGKADVIFISVGMKGLTVSDVEKVVKMLDAKVIVPIHFKNEFSSEYDLKTLEEFLEKSNFATKEIGSNEFTVTKETLPKEPTVYILKVS